MDVILWIIIANVLIVELNHITLLQTNVIAQLFPTVLMLIMFVHALLVIQDLFHHMMHIVAYAQVKLIAVNKIHLAIVFNVQMV